MHGGKLLVCRRSAGANNVFIAISAVKYTNWTKTRLTDTWIDSLPTLYMYEDMCNGNTNQKCSSRFRQKRETYQMQAGSHWQLISILQYNITFNHTVVYRNANHWCGVSVPSSCWWRCALCESQHTTERQVLVTAPHCSTAAPCRHQLLHAAHRHPAARKLSSETM